MAWIVGSNCAGYLPDAEPTECANMAQAKEVLISMLKYDRDGILPINEHDDDSEAMVNNLNDAILDVERHKSGRFSLSVNDWEYWIERA